MNLSKERIRIKLMGFQDADGSGKYRTWPVLVQRPTLDVNISYPSSLLDCTGPRRCARVCHCHAGTARTLTGRRWPWLEVTCSSDVESLKHITKSGSTIGTLVDCNDGIENGS